MNNFMKRNIVDILKSYFSLHYLTRDLQRIICQSVCQIDHYNAISNQWK